jgi:hypothetical protein
MGPVNNFCKEAFVGPRIDCVLYHFYLFEINHYMLERLRESAPLLTAAFSTR